MNDRPPPFPIGHTTITAAAAKRLNATDVFSALQWHARTDWGDCTPSEYAAYNRALLPGCRLLSLFQDRTGTRYWIMSEPDLSITTVFLPGEH
jgi:hypothetical protein